MHMIPFVRPWNKVQRYETCLDCCDGVLLMFMSHVHAHDA